MAEADVGEACVRRQFTTVMVMRRRRSGITLWTVRRWLGASPIFREAAEKVRERSAQVPDVPVAFMKDEARYELLKLQRARRGPCRRIWTSG